MSKSIIRLVDELPQDNITVKVLKALDVVAPGQWDNLVGFDPTIEQITGETDPQTISRIRDRAASLYLNNTKDYKGAIGLYQLIDSIDVAMATAALANKVGDKISFLSFLGKITPKSDTAQTIDLLLKIAVEVIAFCKLNGLPQPNPQLFAASLGDNYQGPSFIRMVALVCIDAVLPLGPNFLAKIQEIIQGLDTGAITQNPAFAGIQDQLPGNNTGDRVGFLTQCFNAVQGWMNEFVTKTGITPEAIANSLGNFIQGANDHLDVVAAVLDQITNYYEHTGIQTVARRLILDAYDLVKADLSQSNAEGEEGEAQEEEGGDYKESDQFSVGDKIEVWDDEDEDWYEATVRKVKVQKGRVRYFIHYTGYGSSDDEWVKERDARACDFEKTDDHGYAVGQKVQVWDDEDEEWYLAVITEINNEKDQYLVHYIDEEDDSSDEWVDVDDIC